MNDRSPPFVTTISKSDQPHAAVDAAVLAVVFMPKPPTSRVGAEASVAPDALKISKNRAVVEWTASAQ